ncbi:MAG: DNA-directed RNA polymerase subunit omega, partial [Rothia dentocariosa]|nr:DNA-directed RNA polymerase subunit omega [Rothia dentocariosa]
MANETKEDYNFVDGTAPEGIVNPSADALIEKAESKYGLVI